MTDRKHDRKHDRDPSDLPALPRDPMRKMPTSLHQRLLAIPADAAPASAPASTMAPGAVATARRPLDDESVDQLYGHALRAASGPRSEAEPDVDPQVAEILRADSMAARVVETLIAVLADCRRLVPVPGPLAARLRDARAELRRRDPLPAWIAEPRWAAAACLVFAFALTFGTGDAAARFQEAKSNLQATQATVVASSDEALGGWVDAAGQQIRRPVDLAGSWLSAIGVRVEAWTGRVLALAERALPVSDTSPWISPSAETDHSPLDSDRASHEGDRP